jgi:hypothetical protein
MIGKDIVGLKLYLFKRRFLFLLILLLTLIVVVPFIGDYSGFRIVVDIFATGVFIAALYAISAKKRQLIFAFFFVVPTIATLWMDYFTSGNWTLVASGICGVLFFGFAIAIIVNFIRSQNEVTTEMIFAAVVVYLLMAILWADLYRLLETLSPGSFEMPTGEIQNDRILFLYFSLVTISTLGYGDMTPLTDRAAGLASAEAITGQIYLVVLVAWLVGMHVSKKSK